MLVPTPAGVLRPIALRTGDMMAHRVAFITGITGKDASSLAELLLAQDYRVHGLVRRASSSNTARIQHLIDAGSERDGSLTLHHRGMTATTALTRRVERDP